MKFFACLSRSQNTAGLWVSSSRCSLPTRMASRNARSLLVCFSFSLLLCFRHTHVWYTRLPITSVPWNLPASRGPKSKDPRDGKALRSVTRVAHLGGSTPVPTNPKRLGLCSVFPPLVWTNVHSARYGVKISATRPTVAITETNTQSGMVVDRLEKFDLVMVTLGEIYSRLDPLRPMVDENGRE